MTEITAEGQVSATTASVIDNKNGTVPKPSSDVPKKSVADDLASTFSSPTALLLVVALIVTWSAVAIVMFDLMDYKSYVGGISKLGSDPMKVIDEVVEESTDWIHGVMSLLSDMITPDDDDEDDEGDTEKPLKRRGEDIMAGDYDGNGDNDDSHEDSGFITGKEEGEGNDGGEEEEEEEDGDEEEDDGEAHPSKWKAQPVMKKNTKETTERKSRDEKKAPPKEVRKVKVTKAEEKTKMAAKPEKKVEKAKKEIKAVEKAKPKAKPKQEKPLKTESKGKNSKKDAEDAKSQKIVEKKLRDNDKRWGKGDKERF